MITLGTQGKNTFLADVNRRSGANVLECYQCGKCVSTCPVSGYMDFPPREIMQLIKLGQRNEVYMANSTWFCLTCSACSGRCPREIEIPAVMEAIRHMALEEQYVNSSAKVRSIRKFHNIFLDMIRRYGRSYELRLMVEHNIRTRDLFKDVTLAPTALLKGKIPLLVKPVKSAQSIRRMFKQAEKLKKKQS